MSEQVEPYHKDRDFEKTWGKVNERLLPLEQDLIKPFEKPNKPILLIAGTQRSGTTFLEQVIIESFDVGYVDNIMARFWNAPYLGALLTNEIRRRKPEGGKLRFESELGATYGYEGPHEFGFFWDRWVNYEDSHQLGQEAKKEIDSELLLKELAAMESVFDTLLVFKNPLAFTLNIPIWADLIPNSIFLICQRDPLYVAQSTLKSRVKRYNNKNKWWSIKPKEYYELKGLPCHEQIVGQIYHTERRIKESITDLEEDRYLFIEYKDLCASPSNEMNRIESLISNNGYDLESKIFSPTPFENRNDQKVEDSDLKKIQDAFNHYYSQNNW